MAHESAAPEAAHSSSQSDPSLSRSVSFSRLNAQAPEFVPTPRASAQPPRLLVPPPPPPPPFHHHVPIQAHVIPVHHPHPHHVPVQVQYQPHPHHSHHHHNHNHHQYYEQEVAPQAQIESDHAPTSSNKNKLPEEASLKVLNQVLGIKYQLPTAFFFCDSCFGTLCFFITFLFRH